MFAEALIATEAIYYLRESHNCPRTFDTNFTKQDKVCWCLRPGKSGELELFSRFSTGWKCGVHADWVEWISCRFFKEDRTDFDRRAGRWNKRCCTAVLVIRLHI